MTLVGYIDWLKAHEKLLIVVLGAALAFSLYGKGLNAWIEHDKRQADIAAQKVQADAVANKALADNNKLIADDILVLKVQMQRQELLIQQAMNKRADDTAKQKKTDDAMNASELAQRTQALLKVGHIEPSSVQSGSLVFDDTAAHANVNALEDLQQAKADVIDLKSEVVSQKSLVAKQEEQVGGLQKEVTGLKVELADEKVSHKKDVDLERAKAKRSWLRGFKVGVVAGAAGGELFRIFVLHKP